MLPMMLISLPSTSSFMTTAPRPPPGTRLRPTVVRMYSAIRITEISDFLEPLMS